MEDPVVSSLAELKINYISEEQYQNLLENNLINENEIYLTPKSPSDNVEQLDGYVTTEEFESFQSEIINGINTIYSELTVKIEYSS